MADNQELTGEGTLSDSEANELASVTYRVDTLVADNSEWGGEIYFPYEDTVVEAGLYVLTLDDGTQVDINLDSAVDPEGREHAFKGIGVFGQRVMG